MKNFIKMIIATASLFSSQNLNAQEWFCDIKPGLKLAQTSFFQSKYIEKYNNTNYQLDYSKQRQLTKLSLEPELFFDFYKKNKKWHFGVGISTYNWTSKSKFDGSVRVDLNPQDEDTIHHKIVTIDLVARNVQFMFTGTRQIIIDNVFKKKINSNLILGIGVIGLYPGTDETEFIDFQDDSETPLDYDYFVSRQLLGSRLSNRFSLALLLKYELNIMSKVTNKNLFNLTFSYQQGFSNFNVIRVDVINNINIKSSLYTSSLGSGLRFGVSKTLSFEKRKLSN